MGLRFPSPTGRGARGEGAKLSAKYFFIIYLVCCGAIKCWFLLFSLRPSPNLSQRERAKQLQPDNPRRAAFPQISIQSISSVDHQQREIDYSSIIDPAVISNDHDAIGRPNFLIV